MVRPGPAPSPALPRARWSAGARGCAGDGHDCPTELLQALVLFLLTRKRQPPLYGRESPRGHLGCLTLSLPRPSLPPSPSPSLPTSCPISRPAHFRPEHFTWAEYWTAGFSFPPYSLGGSTITTFFSQTVPSRCDLVEPWRTRVSCVSLMNVLHLLPFGCPADSNTLRT